MSFSLKPRVFLTGFLPGFLFIVGFLILYEKCDPTSVKLFAERVTLFSGISIVILSFIVGQIFDSFRDFVLEWLIGKIKGKEKDINWYFFYDSSNDNIEKLDNNYYLFYLVNLNISIAIAALMVLVSFNLPSKIPDTFFISKTWLLIILGISIIILVADSMSIRIYIVKITKQVSKSIDLPHTNVFTRLGISNIDGVGVFAILKIPKGTYIFSSDEDEIVWLKEDQIDMQSQPEIIKKMYSDFCIIKTEGSCKVYGCPKNFTDLKISWYLNSSTSPNVGCDKDYNFYALQDIEVGDELTVDYSSFSD